MPNSKRRKQSPQAKPSAAEDKGANESASALAALYLGEKTDTSYMFNTAMVMMGVAVAYLIGAIPFVDALSNEPIGWLFVLLLPIPLWLIVAFHSLMTLNALSHGISVRIIEDELFDASGLRVKRELVGSAAGDQIMDITQSKIVHRITSVAVYGGVALLVIGFTAYNLYSANAALKDYDSSFRERVVVIAITIYSLLALMVAGSWIAGLRTINRGRDDIP